MSEIKKVLIIRFSSIGDIVLTTPVIRALKFTFPDAEIHFCTKSQYAFIPESNPYLTKVHALERSLKDLIVELKKEKYDLVVDLHNNLRSQIIKSFLPGKKATFEKLNWEKWLMVRFKINKLPNKHIVARYLEPLKKYGVKSDERGLDYFIPEKDEVERSWLPENFKHDYIAVVIGGQHETKKLPYKKLVELCDKLNRPVVLLGGKEDAEMGNKIEKFFSLTDSSAFSNEELADGINKKTVIFNACGKFNVNQSASIIKQSRAVFAHDTGLMHIAAAFKKELYTIWGNTIPEFGMYPYNTRFTIFENKKLDCRPCSKIGFSKCPKGHFNCMNKQIFDFYIPE